MASRKEADTKQWTAEDVEELVEVAKSKGIKQYELAKEWLGVHPTTLSYWMSRSKSYKEPPDIAKKLLSCIEPHIRKLK